MTRSTNAIASLFSILFADSCRTKPWQKTCFRKPACAFWKTPTASIPGLNSQPGYILWPTTCVLDELRRRRQRMSIPAEKIATPPPACDPHDHLLARESAAATHQLLAALKPHLRAVVVVRILRDCSQEETAKIIGVPVGTVKSRLHHALKQLRRMASGQ